MRSNRYPTDPETSPGDRPHEGLPEALPDADPGQTPGEKQDDSGRLMLPVSFREWIRSFFSVFKRDFRSTRTAFLAVLLVFAALTATAVPLVKREMEKGEGNVRPPMTFSISIVDKGDSYFGTLFAKALEDVKYLDAVYADTFEQAKERLDRNEIILFFAIPPDLFEQTRTGSVRESVELYLNPQKPAEAGYIAVLIRQYYFAVDRLYSAVFGYQHQYEKLGGEEEESWRQATRQSLDAISAFFGKSRFAVDGRSPGSGALLHAGAGILMLFAFLPAMGVLAETRRRFGSDLENRITLISGRAVPALSRIVLGLWWWVVLVVPWLIVLRITGILQTIGPLTAVLAGVYLAGALLMLFVGRSKASAVTVFQTGWLIFFALLLSGGVLYPASLFPAWLSRGARLTPMYCAMEVVSQAMTDKGAVPSARLFLSFWPILPALLLAVTGMRRRRA
ncbi:MAG TPA: ABC transporter permease [Bacillota bacterium]|nr:ABC transporter permease [Bacillota bacterium]